MSTLRRWWAALRPELRPVDAVVAALLVLVVAVAALAVGAQPGAGTGVAVAALVAGSVQCLPVLWRRERPIAALVVFAVSVPLLGAVAGTTAVWAWAVLVFAVARRAAPGRGAVAVVATALLAPLAAGIARPGEPDTGLGYAVGLAVTVVPILAGAAALGVAARGRAARLAARRRRDERERLADALADQRARLAGDLRDLVAARVERVVARTRALGPGDAPDLAARLGAVADEARAALAGMRRALTLLRAPADPVDAGGPELRPGARWAPGRDGLALAGAVAAITAGLALLAGVAAPRVRPGPAADLLALLDVDPVRSLGLVPLAVQVMAVAWWRRAPLPALVVATVGSVGAAVLGTTHLVTETSWGVIVYGAGLGAGVVASAVTVTLCTAAVLATTLTTELPAALDVSPASWALSYLLVPAVWGLGVLQRRTAQADARRAAARAAATAARAVEAQRLGLARELHDVLAHELSALVVTLHAARVAPDPATLATIGEAGERIASALPSLLDPSDPAGPEHGALNAAAVEALVAPVRDAGLPVRVEVVGVDDGAPADRPEADVFAARILTEALTNALRHAGATPTRVTVRHDEDAVTVEVVDAGVRPGHRRPAEGSGLGLLGMRERAALVGGTVEAGPVGEVGEGGDGWRVAARLPRRAAGLLLEEEGGDAGSAPRRTITAPAAP